jgi:hypothetical protein
MCSVIGSVWVILTVGYVDSAAQVMAMDAALVAGVKIDNVERFCRELGASPRTFYRRRARIQAEGRWRERSRRPQTSPGCVGAELDAWICERRADLGVDNGADFIRAALQRVHAQTGPSWAVPARSTINRVLHRHHLLQPSPASGPVVCGGVSASRSHATATRSLRAN